MIRYYHALLKKMGLPTMPLHNLHHACASYHLAAGTNPRIVSQLLGHSSVGITLQTYSHLLPGVFEDAAKKMDSVFSH